MKLFSLWGSFFATCSCSCLNRDDYHWIWDKQIGVSWLCCVLQTSAQISISLPRQPLGMLSPPKKEKLSGEPTAVPRPAPLNEDPPNLAWVKYDPSPTNILLPCAVQCIQTWRWLGNDFRALVSKGKSGGGCHIQPDHACIREHGRKTVITNSASIWSNSEGSKGS